MYIIPILIISPLLTMSCNSWFSIWMLMELNLLTFIPLIIYLNKYFKELSFKYFIVQSISSSILILLANSSILSLNNNFIWIKLIMNFSLFLKLGFPPFQFWFVSMMNSMNWINCFILSTWQKIIPMILLMMIFFKMMLLILILYSSLIATILGLNHQSLRIILSYSSINHMNWMMLTLMISEMMWILYFSLYFTISLSIMLILNNYNIYYINQMFMLNQFKTHKFLMFSNLISMCGLPPMFGFITKWMSIYFFTLNNFYLMNMIMIVLSILTFIFYTRMIISFLMISSSKNKLLLINKFNKLQNLNNYLLMLNFSSLWIMSIWFY